MPKIDGVLFTEHPVRWAAVLFSGLQRDGKTGIMCSGQEERILFGRGSK